MKKESVAERLKDNDSSVSVYFFPKEQNKRYRGKGTESLSDECGDVVAINGKRIN